MLCRACGTTVVPPYQRPGTGLIPGTDDHPRDPPHNDSVTNLAKNLTDTTRVHAGRVAVRVDNAAMTYRALDEASARVAGLLHERGLKPGDRIGIMMPNVAEVPVVYYGILRAGGVVVPMNPLLKAREVAYYSRRLRGPGWSSPGTRLRGAGPRRRRSGRGGVHRRRRGR